MNDRLPDRTDWLREPLASYPAEPPFPEFTEFEQLALRDVAAVFGDQANAFLEQIAAARVVDRVNTKVGFYTRVAVDRAACQPLQIRTKGAHFDVDGLAHPLGMVLWENDGYLSTIEGYTYEEGAPLERLRLADLKYRKLVHLG